MTKCNLFDPLYVRKIYDESADKYSDKRDLFNNDSQLNKLTAIVKPPANVLDLCSGDGYIAKRLCKRGYKVTGIELSKELLKKSRNNVPDAEFIEGNIVDVNFDRQSFSQNPFDLIVCFYALFHLRIRDQFLVIKKVHAALQEGGWFYATIMSTDLIKSEYPKLQDPARFEGSYHFEGFDRPYARVPDADYKDFLSNTGFENITIETITTGCEAMPWILARKAEA